MPVTGKVALISLFRRSDIDRSADELALELREKLESNSLSRKWVIDKVTVLDEATAITKDAPARKTKKLAIV